MIDQISLIVEGDEDVRFVQDFITFHFAQNIDRNSFIVIGGKSETIHDSIIKIQSSTASGNSNVVLFDADDTDYDSTLNKINTAVQKHAVKFDSVFLFPDNKSKGNLESLLRDSVVKGNEGIFKCIEDYAACKDTLNLKRPRVNDEKEKLWIYHGSFEESGNAHGSKRSYLDQDIWDLNSPILKSLKEYLEQFLK